MENGIRVLTGFPWEGWQTSWDRLPMKVNLIREVEQENGEGQGLEKQPIEWKPRQGKKQSLREQRSLLTGTLDCQSCMQKRQEEEAVFPKLCTLFSSSTEHISTPLDGQPKTVLSTSKDLGSWVLESWSSGPVTSPPSEGNAVCPLVRQLQGDSFFCLVSPLTTS